MSNGYNATAFHSVVIMFRKANAFPLWRVIEKRWNKKVVSLVSPVTVVMRLPISCVGSIAISCHTAHTSCFHGKGIEDIIIIIRRRRHRVASSGRRVAPHGPVGWPVCLQRLAETDLVYYYCGRLLLLWGFLPNSLVGCRASSNQLEAADLPTSPLS